MNFRWRQHDEPLETINTMCDASPEKCRWGCGNQCAHDAPNTSGNEYFGDVLMRYVSRRGLLKGAGVAAAMFAAGSVPLVHKLGEAAAQGTTGINFTPIPLTGVDQVQVSPGYSWCPLIRWGDPLFMDAAPFKHGENTAAEQLRQFGYNCDFIGFLPLGANRPDRGILFVNHEYTNPEIMFPGYNVDSPTKQQVDVELAAHGASVVYIQRDPEKSWVYVPGAGVNRRISGFTKCVVTGPAAGHDWLKTAEDPHGYYVTGMLNNCGGGVTPWGTVLTAEENFNQYFANNNTNPDAKKKAAHQRYGLTSGASERKWERYYDRFDIAKEPNEPFRFGYIVEIDPFDPNQAPRKRSALGRFKHEAGTIGMTKSGHAAVYMGDDERFDYMYKFVTRDQPDLVVRENNADLLDHGTLYVAKFNDDGTGRWLPLVFGLGPFTPANGWNSQAEICVLTRQAADAAGATKMDRPEDFEASPITGKVYCALTNNTQRGTTGRPGVDGPNPRANNAHGQILELIPDGGDHGSLTFRWNLPILCGRPTDAGAYYGGQDLSKVSPMSAPDNLCFDKKGNLWVSTDGQTSTFRQNDGVFAVPMEGPERGFARMLVSGVPGGETASLDFDDKDLALFVSIQHPGENSNYDSPSSTFPDGTKPRPSVIVVWKDDGGTVGS